MEVTVPVLSVLLSQVYFSPVVTNDKSVPPLAAVLLSYVSALSVNVLLAKLCVKPWPAAIFILASRTVTDHPVFLLSL